jgi:hypothetical protein
VIYSYVYEELWLAVRWLAITQGSTQERVRDAYVFHLAHIHQIDLPEELRGVLKEIEQKLNENFSA